MDEGLKVRDEKHWDTGNWLVARALADGRAWASPGFWSCRALRACLKCPVFLPWGEQPGSELGQTCPDRRGALSGTHPAGDSSREGRRGGRTWSVTAFVIF